MKKILILSLALVSYTAAISQAKSGAIKTNPIGMAFGVINLAYELPLNDKSSLQLGVSVVSVDFAGTSVSGFGIAPEYRIYGDEAMEGFYFGPVVSYNTLTLESGSDEGTLSVIGGGAQLGWNWIKGKNENFVLDLGLGAIYNSGSVTVDAGSDTFDTGVYDGIAPIISFAIGYAW